MLSSGFGIPTCPTRAVSALARPRARRREGAAGRNRGGAAAGAIFGAGGSVALRSLRESRAGVALLYDRRRQTCRHRRRPHHLAVHASSRANRPGPPAAQEATRPSAQRCQRPAHAMAWHQGSGPLGRGRLALRLVLASSVRPLTPGEDHMPASPGPGISKAREKSKGEPFEKYFAKQRKPQDSAVTSLLILGIPKVKEGSRRKLYHP